MSEVKESVADEWIRFKLEEAVKKDPLYKERESGKAVMKEPGDVHDGISDFLLRVLSKEDIAKLNYINGFNPERDIHNDPIPNKKKEKIKESVELKEEDGEEENATEPVEDVNNEAQENPEDKEDIDSTLDIEDIEKSEEEAEGGEETSMEDVEAEANKEAKNKGVGAFDRIIDQCEKDEILSKAITALNSPDIAAARKEFYEWFDSFDDEHASDSLPTVKDDSEEEPVEDTDLNDDEGKDEGEDAGNSNAEEPANDEEAPAEDKKDEGINLDDLFA